MATDSVKSKAISCSDAAPAHQETGRSGVGKGACYWGGYRSIEGRVVATAQTTKDQEDGLDPEAGDIDAGLTALALFIIEAEARAG